MYQCNRAGARLVHACGFDSIPSDLGCYFLQREAEARYAKPCGSVKLFVNRMKGTFSGGTVASLLNALEEAGRAVADPVWRLPFAAPWTRKSASRSARTRGSETFAKRSQRS
mgnify:CR=1 FL=1